MLRRSGLASAPLASIAACIFSHTARHAEEEVRPHLGEVRGQLVEGSR
jgi:hypothetical protein